MLVAWFTSAVPLGFGFVPASFAPSKKLSREARTAGSGNSNALVCGLRFCHCRRMPAAR
jgi:hypothetical protein